MGKKETKIYSSKITKNIKSGGCKNCVSDHIKGSGPANSCGRCRSEGALNPKLLVDGPLSGRSKYVLSNLLVYKLWFCHL